MALEFFIKNLCIEIQQECKEREVECHQNFMTYYLTLLAYDPLWNLDPKMKEIIREDALRLIKFVVTKMRHQSCPSMITLKMQFYFNCNFETKRDIVDVHASNFRVRLSPLIEEIVEAKPGNEVEYDLFLRQIIYYSALWRGLGNPTNLSVYKECYHATLSILDNSELEKFIDYKNDEKLQYLNDVAQICAGIRIFNWTSKLGGEGIDDLPSILAANLAQFRTELGDKLQSIIDKIDILTSAIDYCFIIEPTEYYSSSGTSTEYKQSCELPDGIEYEEIEYFKDMIIIYRQLEVFLRQLLSVVEEIENCHGCLGVEFQECLDSFHSLTHLKAGVPTKTIFPMFADLDNIWQGYQTEIVYLKRMYQIMLDMELYVKDFHIAFDRLEVIIDDRDILNDADRSLISESGEELLDETMSEIEVVPLDSEKFQPDVKFELSGYDIWRLVESQGALIPGNPNLGIVVFNQRNYVFSCRTSAFMFAKYPRSTVNEMLELVRKKVELIALLQLKEDLADVQTVRQLSTEVRLAKSQVPRSNAGQQTELHPVAQNVDPKYMWNVWDHKRAALKLCDMTHCVSKAANTESKRGIFSSGTQTYDAKDVAQQTLKDNYTNTHTPQTYFFGLRGRTDDKQFILDLTKPPEKS